MTAFRDDWWRAPVTAAMISSVQTAGPEDSLTEVAGRLAESRIGALPVVELGTLRGLVTVTDVLEAEVRDGLKSRDDVAGLWTGLEDRHPLDVIDPSSRRRTLLGDARARRRQSLATSGLREVPNVQLVAGRIRLVPMARKRVPLERTDPPSRPGSARGSANQLLLELAP